MKTLLQKWMSPYCKAFGAPKKQKAPYMETTQKSHQPSWIKTLSPNPIAHDSSFMARDCIK